MSRGPQRERSRSEWGNGGGSSKQQRNLGGAPRGGLMKSMHNLYVSRFGNGSGAQDEASANTTRAPAHGGSSGPSNPALVERRAKEVIKQSCDESGYPTYSYVKTILCNEFGEAAFCQCKRKVQEELLRACADMKQQERYIEVVLLFDVDETLAVSENSLTPYKYNEPLIKVWKKTLDCLSPSRAYSFLFTSQVLCTPAFVYNPKEEPMSEPSRVKLRMHLRDKYKLMVPAVITTYDPFNDLDFSQRLGAYYRDNIEPFEKAVARGRAIPFDDPMLVEKRKNEKKLQKVKIDHMEATRTDKPPAPPPGPPGEAGAPKPKPKKVNIFAQGAAQRNLPKPPGPKTFMIEYLLGHLQKHSLIIPTRTTKVIMCDDRNDCLGSVHDVIKKNDAVEFLGILVGKKQTEKYYADKIYQFLKNEFNQFPRLKRVAAMMQENLSRSHGPLWRRRHGCFMASDAVQWLLSEGHAICEQAALGLAQALVEYELMRAVEADQRPRIFLNNKTLYEIGNL